jgi:serine protease Do
MYRLLGLLIVAVVLSIAPFRAGAEEDLWLDGTKNSSGVEINLPSFAPVIEKLGSAVVNISTEGTENIGGPAFRPKGGKKRSFPGMEEDEERFPWPFPFLPMPRQGKQTFSSLGSGFVIHPDGYIVTNAHVVQKATKISISFRDDKKTYEAKVIGVDPKTDVALLKVTVPEKISAVVLGDSDKIAPGDWVIAIGNPFRLGHTATVGIVSAKSRKMIGSQYTGYIQTDASINPGNSGGPLFNARGEVIGINTAIYSPGKISGGGFNIGIGFATPIQLVKSIIKQLKDNKKVVRGWLGVLIQPVSEDVASAMKLNEAKGALVADVIPNSPAAKAGFRRGDVILTYDGKPVQENDDLPLMVAETKLGSKVNLEIIRAGKKEIISAKIEELKDEQEGEDEVVDSGAAEVETSVGVSTQEVTPDIARSLGLEEVKGIVVTDVDPDSAGGRAGLKTGDVILEIDSKPVTSNRDFKAATKSLDKNRPILLLIRRGENTIFLTLKAD